VQINKLGEKRETPGPGYTIIDKYEIKRQRFRYKQIRYKNKQ